MELTQEEIIQELKKQQVADKYHAEGIGIVRDYVRRKGCSLEEAVQFVIKWIGINEA